MINKPSNSEKPNFPHEALSSQHDAGKSKKRNEQFREMGRKGLEPLVGVLLKHKGDLAPYLDAFTKALRAGANSLRGENSSAVESHVSEYFTNSVDWISGWQDKLAGNSTAELINLIEEEGRKHPVLAFGASYLVGVTLGRLGLHLGKTIKENVNIH
jgi:hypothetical protein